MGVFCYHSPCESILKEVGLGPRMALKPVLMPYQKVLKNCLDLKILGNRFYYWLIIGKLNNFAMLIHPDIQSAVSLYFSDG